MILEGLLQTGTVPVTAGTASERDDPAVAAVRKRTARTA
ncbi:hypothetical protein M2169_005445 [Streptomyces sp. MJP52]|nr:hypothetical protein [Streptomyces sp. MJP52]